MLRKFLTIVLLLGTATSGWATVDNAVSRNNYVGNGSTKVFPFTFRILAPPDLRVIVSGLTKVLNTDYTVAGVGAQGGGSITLVTAPAASAPVVLTRSIPITQNTDYIPNQAINANTLETNLDRLTMIAQMLNENIIDRNLDQAPTNAIPLSIIGAKGDLIVGSAAATVARLPVGSNGQTIIADSTQSLGVRWSGSISQIIVTGLSPTNPPATNRTILQTAINAIPTTGGVLIIPAGGGCYPIDGALSITKGMIIRGEGAPSVGDYEAGTGFGTCIKAITNGQIVFDIDTKGKVVIEDLAITVAATGPSATGVIGIQLDGPSAGLLGAQSFALNRSFLYGMAIGLDVLAAVYVTIDQSIFWNVTEIGVKFANRHNSDQGDHHILGSTFLSSKPDSVAVYANGGGVHIVATKILFFAYGVVVNAGGFNADTGNLLLVGSSIENFTQAGVYFTRSGGAFTFKNAVIVGNEIASFITGTGRTAILIEANGTSFLNNVTIVGNAIRSVDVGIGLGGGSGISVSNNTFDAVTTGISSGDAGIIVIGQNTFLSTATPLSAAGANTSWLNTNPTTLAAIPVSAANGSVLYCSDCRGPQDAGFVAGTVCTSAGPATGAMAQRIGAVWQCK